MGWPQIIFGVVLVAALLFLSLYYGWRQVVALRRLRANPDLPGEERRYQHRQAVGRLVNSVLLLILAALLTGVMVYLENPTALLVKQHDKERDAAVAKGEKPPELTPEQQQLVRVWVGWWVALLVVLLAVVLLAAIDLWTIRSYGLRQYRKLQADRRAMIERQAARLRHGRNGD